MNRTVKDATIKASHYPDLDALEAHVLAFVAAYNFAKHLEALRWRTPFQAVRDAWEAATHRPSRLIPATSSRDRTGRGGVKKAVAGEPEDHALGRSGGGFTTKLHLVTDAGGLPLALHLTAGQRHESRAFEPLMRAVRLPRRRGRPRTRPKRLLSDRAYSTPAIRDHCRRRRIAAVIPQRADEIERRSRRRGRPLAFDLAVYRKRNAAERCVGWLKGCRSVGTRFEKLAVNFLAMVKLACARLLLRRLRPSDRTRSGSAQRQPVAEEVASRRLEGLHP